MTGTNKEGTTLAENMRPLAEVTMIAMWRDLALLAFDILRDMRVAGDGLNMATTCPPDPALRVKWSTAVVRFQAAGAQMARCMTSEMGLACILKTLEAMGPIPKDADTINLEEFRAHLKGGEK